MRRFFSSISSFLDWWTSTLISCFPQSWILSFSKINKKIDLVIAHQGDTIFIQTERGQIIDSISLSDEGADKSVQLGSNFNELDDEENKIFFSKDPTLQKNEEAIDLALAEQLVDQNDQSVDFNLGDEFLDKGIDDKTEILDLNPVHITEGDDTTIYLDSNEEVTQLLEMNAEDEDTIILKNDQGKLINIDSGEPETDANTLLFRNKGGKIEPVGTSLTKQDDDTTEDHDDNDGYQLNDKTIQGFDVVARLLSLYQGNKKCLYLLPEDKVFIINLNYPIQAVQNIESVLRFDLEKHIPLNLKEIRYFYALNLNSSRQKVNVEVAVMKSIDFDLLNGTLTNYIDKGLLCTTKSFFQKFGRKINFVEKVPENSWFSIFNTSNIHLAINAALFLLLLAIPYYLYHQNNDALKINTSQDMTKVQEIISSINLINNETKFGSKLSLQLGDVPRLIPILSIMSENIDQQAWLSRYNFKNNEIRIKGEAVSATAVSDELSSTGLFESIKFVSSIRKNPRNEKESFELLLRVKVGA